MPVHMGDQINKLLRVQHQLTQRLGRDPSVEELAQALDVTPQKVENMIQVARRPLSLETPTDDEEDSVLGDFIQDEEVPAPDETATYNLLREHLDTVLERPAAARSAHFAAALRAAGWSGVHLGGSWAQDGRHARARAPDRSPGAQPPAPPGYPAQAARVFGVSTQKRHEREDTRSCLFWVY